MFIFGGVPALMIAFIRFGVHESKKWQDKFGDAKERRPTMAQAFSALFTPQYKTATLVMSGLFTVSIILLWAGSIYVPTAVTQLAVRAGNAPADAARLASYGSIVLAIGTIIGCVLVPPIAERFGRRTAMALFLTILGISAAFGFGVVFYQADALMPFFVAVFFMGIGGANFAVYTIWLPEQYTTDCRASAIGFISSVGRFVGVAMVFLLGAGIARYGSLGVPVAVVALAFVFGLLLLPKARETRGQVLPA
jgi:MFS family permease